MSRHTDEKPRGIGIDRTRCTGKGICASLLPETIVLDEWGYPIIAPQAVDGEMGDVAIRMCPARALFWQELRTPARR